MSDNTSDSSYAPSYQSTFSTQETETTLSITPLESSEEDSFSTNSSIDINLDGLFSTQHSTSSSNKPSAHFDSNTHISSAPTADSSSTDFTSRTVSTLSLLNSPKGTLHLTNNTDTSSHQQVNFWPSTQSIPSYINTRTHSLYSPTTEFTPTMQPNHS